LAFGQQWTQQQSPEPVYGQSTSQQNSSQRNPNTTQDQSGDAACDPTDTQAGDCNMPWEERTTPDRTRRPSNTSEIPQTNRAEPLPKDKRLENPQSQKVIDPPTEFQKFVERSVGKRLPIYGASLFNRVPSTYAPSDQVPAANDYAIGPGDELDIRVWGQINFERKLTVDRSGEIFIPQVGRVSVTGLAFSDLPNALKTSIGRVYRNFEVSVSLGQLRSIQVFVMGHARRPGAYTVSALSTLVNALFVSGGPSPQGSMRNIELKRGGQVVTHFNLYDLLLHGDKTKDAPLKTGDVVFIAPVGARVAVTGSVENPAIYEISAGESLREALADAVGLSPTAAAQKAFLERIDNHSLLVSEDILLSGSGLDTKLQNGDILQLLNVVPRFSRTVSLKGNVADPVRMAWHDGMRISDLIPDKAALLTRDYWTEHNRLAPKAIDVTAAAPDTEEERHTEDQDAPPANVTSRERGVTQRRFTKKNDYQQPAPDINWTYAVIERLDEQHTVDSVQSGESSARAR
jgi:protein involved in polysaccharide export with SLBB domain